MKGIVEGPMEDKRGVNDFVLWMERNPLMSYDRASVQNYSFFLYSIWQFIAQQEELLSWIRACSRRFAKEETGFVGLNW